VSELFSSAMIIFTTLTQFVASTTNRDGLTSHLPKRSPIQIQRANADTIMTIHLMRLPQGDPARAAIRPGTVHLLSVLVTKKNRSLMHMRSSHLQRGNERLVSVIFWIFSKLTERLLASLIPVGSSTLKKSLPAFYVSSVFMTIVTAHFQVCANNSPSFTCNFDDSCDVPDITSRLRLQGSITNTF
jgi:hypothetical protein